MSATVAKVISTDSLTQDMSEETSRASYSEATNTAPAMPTHNSQAPLICSEHSSSGGSASTGGTEEEREQQQQRASGSTTTSHRRNSENGRVVSWQSSAEPDEIPVIPRPVEQVSSSEATSSSPEEAHAQRAQSIAGDDRSQRDEAMTVEVGGESAASSLYAVSASLVGGMTGTSINGNMSIMGMGGGGAPSGTLSPQYTLVNSDGASLRVHTGSIRERNLNRRISAIHEDDSDAYSESRRSDSLVFVHNLSPSSSVLQRRRYRLYNHHQPVTPYDGVNGAADDGGGTRASIAGATDTSAGGMVRAVGESDCFSMVSGISEGGASTTRVRMATDRAYDALRIGPSNTAFGYGNGQYYSHRPMSFATSSDPGLPSAGSYYDYYLGPDDYVPASSAFPDDSDFDGSGANDDQSGEIISLIRSDVAVYSGAGDDVKFPFLPDNFSELGGSIVYSPGGALSVDLDRLSRDQSDFSYVTPVASNYYSYQTPEPSVVQQSLDTQSHYNRLRPQMKLRKKGKGVKMPAEVSASGNVNVSSNGNEGTSRGNSNPVSPSSDNNDLHRRYTRRYRNHSARETYHHHQTATEAAAQAVAEAVAANSSMSNGAMETSRDANVPSTSPRLRADTGTIRPNALMRFIKRITPKN
ncbi:hypothetical protein H4R99_001194 [Coemansia sp. RSA 1722]|nr:hypothetical protein LPJ57_000506 [Coemansia sp. RSA 486]KAJ2237236.1 hypothetical protein IWW45_001111 [Coemansia sp. RSA 485]KAJ2601400.1 hypothetical protein GGF39_001247 [Coemansia sp. RSA 1721]KAJ2605335.1 hypothetical protein H4R99_001194 [Coemansia sp. RSA 1722]KAJ2638779.1 hypothetical protein GGF40_001377 [Coemansia sp. RSA 1286]